MTVRVPRALTERDPESVAAAAGLVHLPDTAPGIQRRPRRSGFSYVHDGNRPSSADLERIERLAVPPAWDDVWISPSPDGYLQATGIDDAGRKQYLYHDDFRRFCERQKFDRLRFFARAIVLIRKGVADALDRPLGSRDHAVAAAVQLIDRYLLRVGNEESAAKGHHGASTLTIGHLVDDVACDRSDGTRPTAADADITGFIALEYTAKSGQQRQVIIEDDDLADVLTTLAADAEDGLFWFDKTQDGTKRRADARDINRFIVECAGPAFSAKDFRTWGASSTALQARADGKGLLDAVDLAADELGNTRAVARASYVHPSVLQSGQEIIDDAWGRSRRSKWLDRSESALAKLLGDEVRRTP